MGMKGMLLVVLKLVPLGIYLRSAACKYEMPVLGCDAPLCPVAIGQPGDCAPSANTAEQKAWCEHGWAPWGNGVLGQLREAGLPLPDDFAFACDESNNYQMMKIIGAAELLGYFLLWVNPEAGAFILTSLMAGAIHFHMTAMGDKPEALVLQFSLLVAGLFVFLFDRKPSTGKAKAN
eukprot:PRCOL_00002116-RA